MKKLSYLFLVLLMLSCTTDDNNNVDNSNTLEKEWLYTHTALEATATSSTTIVMPFTEDIFAFTDRPNREHKYISGDEFASYWNDYDDENSFKLDPPNAVLTWVDEDGVEEVEVVITDAHFDGTNMIYTIENTTITANQSFEEVSLFVDGNGSNNAVFLASNGVTVKASAGAVNGDTGVLDGVTYTVVDLSTLNSMLVYEEDVTKVVTSLITDMSGVFATNTTFNQDISTWDVSNVTDMSGLFYESAFNQDISYWDVSKVTDMSSMFYITPFNQNISSWDVSNVTDMSGMFKTAYFFNQDLSSWNVNNVINCTSFSDGASAWVEAKPDLQCNTIPNAVYLDANGITVKASAGVVVGDTGMVNGITYTVVDLSNLTFMISTGDDVTKVCTSLTTDMSGVFATNTTFNQDISSWDVSNVTNMNSMFNGTPFNQDISNWDVSSVTNMSYMFNGAAAFNQDISSWDVSSVTNMNSMFFGSSFNQDISTWDVSNVTDMSFMFSSSSLFNQDISNWDVSNVTTMDYMFGENTTFNQPIGAWNVSNVTDMTQMFRLAASFNQDLSSWNVNNVINCIQFNSLATQWTLPKPNFTNCTP